MDALKMTQRQSEESLKTQLKKYIKGRATQIILIKVIFASLDPHSGHNRKWAPSDICCLYPSPVANDCLITYHSHNRLLQITNRVSCGAYVRDNYFPIAHWEREKCVLVTNCRVSGVNVTREKSKYFRDVTQKWVTFVRMQLHQK